MPPERSLVMNGVDVVKEVHEVLDGMSEFAGRVRSGEWRGAHREADPKYRQHRDRRVRSRASDGLQGLRHYSDRG